jgi:hypothetical protein
VSQHDDKHQGGERDTEDPMNLHRSKHQQRTERKPDPVENPESPMNAGFCAPPLVPEH